MENLTIYDVVNIISKTKVDFHCEENCDSWCNSGNDFQWKPCSDVCADRHAHTHTCKHSTARERERESYTIVVGCLSDTWSPPLWWQTPSTFYILTKYSYLYRTCSRTYLKLNQSHNQWRQMKCLINCPLSLSLFLEHVAALFLFAICRYKFLAIISEFILTRLM